MSYHTGGIDQGAVNSFVRLSLNAWTPASNSDAGQEKKQDNRIDRVGLRLVSQSSSSSSASRGAMSFPDISRLQLLPSPPMAQPSSSSSSSSNFDSNAAQASDATHSSLLQVVMRADPRAIRIKIAVAFIRNFFPFDVNKLIMEYAKMTDLLPNFKTSLKEYEPIAAAPANHLRVPQELYGSLGVQTASLSVSSQNATEEIQEVISKSVIYAINEIMSNKQETFTGVWYPGDLQKYLATKEQEMPRDYWTGFACF